MHCCIGFLIHGPADTVEDSCLLVRGSGYGSSVNYYLDSDVTKRILSTLLGIKKHCT